MSEDGGNVTMACRKLWRHPSRRSFSYIFLFFSGILTCLLSLQILQLNVLSFSSDESPIYYSLTDKDTETSPCDLKVKYPGHERGDVRNSVKDGVKGGLPEGPSYYEEVLSVDRQEISKTSAEMAQDGFNAIRTSINRFERRKKGKHQGHQGAQGHQGQQMESDTTLWVVTPTFYRPEQKPELTRLAQALLPVNSFVHWLVIDDISQGSEATLAELQNFLEKFPLSFTLLKSLPPRESKIIGKPRGVGGRRAAIAWLRQFAKDGVVYFADDDNTYDSDIFRQMHGTQKVTMWPVGLVTSFGVSSPIVKNGHVVGFYDGWKGHRKFPVDMAGFAINLKMFLAKPNANMPWVAGYEEDELLKSLGVSVHDIVPLANNCTEILVWHTKTSRNLWPTRPKNFKQEIESNTNLKRLLEGLPQKANAGPSSSTKSLQTDDFSILKFFFGGT